MNKIKIWADSLDKNFSEPRESFLFVKDLITFSNEFELASSMKRSDCIVVPQYSNNYINNLVGNYVFDNEKADNIFLSGKPVIVINTGGGTPQEWREFKLPIFDYIYGEVSKNVIIFSTECYKWHREYLPTSVKYLPFDYVGFVDYGLGLRVIHPIQSKEEYLKRVLGTAVVMNRYPPTRDRLFDMVNEQKNWDHFSYQTTPDNQTRIEWDVMADRLYNAKIGFAPDGATGKTERHLFTPSYTVMMKQKDDELEFPYEWVDGVNCLEMVHDLVEGIDMSKEKRPNDHAIMVLNKEKTKDKIIAWLNKPEQLYDIYVNGWHNDENYRIPNYNKNYIAKSIKENL